MTGKSRVVSLIFTCVSVIGASQVQSLAQAAAGPKKAEEQFKNIQVLKGIPADQLIPSMQFITVSLGVECSFCHVKDAFEKDDKKPKQTARKMMEMMFAINKENFAGNREVTCYSCHRGSVHPMSIPAVMTESTKQAPTEPHPAETAEIASGSAKQEAGPTADQLVDKYIQALGGARAIDAVTSRVMKGTIDVGGHSLSIEVYSQDPEKRISFTHMPDGDSVTAFNGQEGWLASPGRPVREMHGSDLDAAAMDADLHLATHLRKMFDQLEVRDKEQVGDRRAYVVIGRTPGKTPVQLYFDVDSGLLLRLVRYGDTALGWIPTQIDYSDYRESDGVKVPYRWTLARPSGIFTIQVSEVQENVPIDPAKFTKPVASEQSKGAAK